jgi:hypothetical protein
MLGQTMASKNLQRSKTQRFHAQRKPNLSPRSRLASSSHNPKNRFLDRERNLDLTNHKTIGRLETRSGGSS